jgi:hypothetical protein
MVPIILIPQLMFNGVAIDFDKLNPKISSSERVPMLGEMMVTRWAFEAVMVRQFKDNELERQFYEYDKDFNDSKYKTSYLLTEIALTLSKCNAALRGEVPKESISEDLELISHELKKELKLFNKQDEVEWEKLSPQKFDSATYQQIDEMIDALRKVYVSRGNVAFNKKDSIRNRLDSLFLPLEKEFTNEKIASLVKNDLAKTRILEVGNKLIRKTTPIYATPDVPENPLNFRTFLYAPEKYFLGTFYDTFWFNVVIIWLMAALGAVVLYLDLLKKLLLLFEKIGDYKFRQQLKKAQLRIRK